VKRIGIFGGTFDPPHNGHLAIAKQALKQCALDRVYFVPAFLPPHKRDLAAQRTNHRLTMVKLAIAGKKQYKLSAMELRRRGVSYTINTLEGFQEKFPNAELILVIGADNLAQFHTWKSPNKILQLASLAVYQRRGFNQSLENHNIAFQQIKGQLLQVSSTEIRNRIEKGKSISKLVPRSVEKYIKQHSLYLNSCAQKRSLYEINCTHR
jgi:nicotinate-nucleotide adenylyltransferase